MLFSRPRYHQPPQRSLHTDRNRVKQSQQTAVILEGKGSNTLTNRSANVCARVLALGDNQSVLSDDRGFLVPGRRASRRRNSRAIR